MQPQPLLSEAQDGRTADTVQDNSYTEVEYRTQGQVLFSGWTSIVQ